jgi:hypothetical protein
MKKVIKASKDSGSKKYWAEVRMKVAITTNSKDVDDIADEVYDEVVSGLGECGIKDYEWVDVASVSPDIRK